MQIKRLRQMYISMLKKQLWNGYWESDVHVDGQTDKHTHTVGTIHLNKMYRQTNTHIVDNTPEQDVQTDTLILFVIHLNKMYRQTDRQTGRQADRQRDRQTHVVDNTPEQDLQTHSHGW